MDIIEIDCITGIEITRPATPREVAQAEKDAEDDKNQAWHRLRSERDLRLTSSDWSQMPDTGYSQSAIGAWRAYRKALRDLPSKTEDPYNPTWPTPPPKPSDVPGPPGGA